MTRTEQRSRLVIASALSLVNIALIASLALAGLGSPAHAQGQNKATIEKPSGGVACPSGWRMPKGNTALCEPMGSTSPKIYANKDRAPCADGYVEELRIWCTKKK